MLLNELFDAETHIREIPSEDFDKLGLVDGSNGALKYACLFQINGEIFLAGFSQPESFRSDAYAFAFAYVDKDSVMHYELMKNRASAAKIYTSVIAALKFLIERSNANTVVMAGHEEKQQAMYKMLAKRLSARYPQFDVDTDNLVIRRNIRHENFA